MSITLGGPVLGIGGITGLSSLAATATVAESSTGGYATLLVVPAPVTTVPPQTVAQSVLTVRDNAIVNGRLVADAGYGTRSHSACRASLYASTGLPDPRTIRTGATARFLPYAEWVAGDVWSSTTGGYPKAYLRHYASGDPYFLDDGVLAFTPSSPVLNPRFSWQRRGVRIAHPSFTFESSGAIDYYSHGGTGSDPGASFLWVLAPRPTPAGFWTLFQTFTTPHQVELRYAQGQLHLQIDSKRATSVPLQMTSGEAIVVTLTLAPGAGRLSVHDRSHRVRTFNNPLTSVDYHSRVGIGSATGGGPDLLHRPYFDLIEMDTWRSAIGAGRIDGVANTLAQVYAVGPT